MNSAEMTPEEEELVQRALVNGGLMDVINDMLRQRAEGVSITRENRALLNRAFDDGNGNTVFLKPSPVQGYFNGIYDGEIVVHVTEINGVLYSILLSNKYRVFVGHELERNAPGVEFNSVPEARAYILGLTSK